MALQWICMAAAALGAAAMLRQELRQHSQPSQTEAQAAGSTGTKRKRTKRQAAVVSDSATTSAAAAAGIPWQELEQLQAFLQRVYSWRGWQGGQYHVTQAWHAAEAAAATAAAGGWQPDFDAKQLTDANCDALLRVIDACFFGGKLLKRLTSRSPVVDVNRSEEGNINRLASSRDGTSAASAAGGTSSNAARQRSSCKVVQPGSPHESWLCYFDVRNIIYVNAWRWNKHQVTAQNPVNCEGVVCTSRLQMLLHTLAHELVHAIVFHLFPEMDRGSPAYLENDRHGPVFQLLNKQLYGHSSDALERVRVMECSH